MLDDVLVLEAPHVDRETGPLGENPTWTHDGVDGRRFALGHAVEYSGGTEPEGRVDRQHLCPRLAAHPQLGLYG